MQYLLWSRCQTISTYTYLHVRSDGIFEYKNPRMQAIFMNTPHHLQQILSTDIDTILMTIIETATVPLLIPQCTVCVMCLL